jgi:hypothetical protein
MPIGFEYSQREKQLMFSVINFVENEKNGPTIPFYKVNERLKTMLGISMSSVEKLKREFREEMGKLEEKIKEEENKQNDLKEKNEELAIRLRHRSNSRAERRFSPMTRPSVPSIPPAREPLKSAHSGRRSTIMSEQQQEYIR